MPVALRPWVAGLALWLALAAITAAQNYTFLDWVGRPIGAWSALSRELVMFGAWAALTPPIVWVARRLRRRGGAWLLTHAPAAVAASLAHTAILVAARGAIDGGPRPPLADAIGATLGRAFVLDVVFYAAIVLAVEAAGWAAAYRRRAAEASRLEASLTRARLDALRGQLQPHFLFNALHAVSSLVDTDPATARRVLVRLSDLLRATLDVRDAEVPLAAELALLDGYLELVRVRFHDRLTVTLDVPPAARAAAVPPLVLQPLVENALRHGIEARPGPGTIAIAVARAGDRLRLTVGDDGPGPGDAAGDGIGLGTTRARLAALYGDAATLRLVARPGGGAEAVVEVPWRELPCAP